MENIIKPIVELFQSFVYVGGMGGIVISAFGLVALTYFYASKNVATKKIESKNSKTSKAVSESAASEGSQSKLLIILFYSLCVLVFFASIYTTSNWRQISGGRLSDTKWAVQLETDNTIGEAEYSRDQRFKGLFNNLVIFLNRSTTNETPRFHLFNLYSTEQEALNGEETAHREWKKLKYDDGQGNSASTVDLDKLCKKYTASDDGRYFICNDQ